MKKTIKIIIEMDYTEEDFQQKELFTDVKLPQWAVNELIDIYGLSEPDIRIISSELIK